MYKNLQYILSIVILKALPYVCMKNTLRGMCKMVNTALGYAPCYIITTQQPQMLFFHVHKHRQRYFKWYIVLNHSQLNMSGDSC